MVKAKIVLISGLTHDGGPRKFERGKAQILTNPDDIRYYQNQGDFAVTILSESKPAPRPVTPKDVVINDATSVDEDDDDDNAVDDDIDDDDDADDEGAEDSSEEDDSEEDDGDDPGEDAPAYTEKDLKKLKKPQLKEIADELGLDTEGTVKELINRILEG